MKAIHFNSILDLMANFWTQMSINSLSGPEREENSVNASLRSLIVTKSFTILARRIARELMVSGERVQIITWLLQEWDICI